MGLKGRSKYDHNKEFDQRLEDFEEEIESFSYRFERSVDRAGKRFEDKFYSTFGMLGPFFSSLLNLIFLLFAIWIIEFMGNDLNSQLLNDVSNFLLNYIALFFGLMMLFNYSSFINKRFREYFKWINPIVNALSVTVVIWILISLFEIINKELNEPFIDETISSVHNNLMLIFLLILVLSYVVFISREGFRTRREITSDKKTIYSDIYNEKINKELRGKNLDKRKRLYRSGKDKLLGGVCGGIAKYVDIDPVVVRIIWVIGAIASFGTAVILYIILWILIPRNPRHRWD